jgi:hypothetical protein
LYKLYKDVLCAAVSKNHHLANELSIDLQELYSEHILLPAAEQYTGYAAFLDKVFTEDKFP